VKENKLVAEDRRGNKERVKEGRNKDCSEGSKLTGI
jgi:hypothetical protein